MMKQYTIPLQKEIKPNGKKFIKTVFENLNIDISNYTYDTVNHTYMIIMPNVLDSTTIEKITLIANTNGNDNIPGSDIELAVAAARLHNQIIAWEALGLVAIIQTEYETAVNTRDAIVGQLLNG